jgi:uncharacterized protein (TIGR02271 family)
MTSEENGNNPTHADPQTNLAKDSNQHAHIQLHQEVLDLSKVQVRTNEVHIHKEVITEEKTITIPITREELVIEKKALSPVGSNQSDCQMEIIRIPISEERIEVTKHPVMLEEVNYYTNSYEEIQHIEETVKRELLHVDTIGHPIIVNEEGDPSLYE